MIKIKNENALKCLILFGSHARGDIDIHSDFDLLGIDDSKDYTVKDVGKVNFSLYSSSEALKLSSEGNLFFLHIITEGKCLFNEDFFSQLKSVFSYKESYLEDAIIAYFLAEKILEKKEIITNWVIANKRISWCVRTILIAISANNRNPIFSKYELASVAFKNKYSSQQSITLIDAKSKDSRDENILFLLTEFLIEYIYLKDKASKGMLYSKGIVSSTLLSIVNTTPVFYR
ncbi:hypothetical protein M976_01168 [Buttiauxella ferragutiae ATCC 51602]|uniref:Polymerase beta nucleotidyltransferase domain-containing protein n=1 Tax=Buttiauxella ferragutiae ATCC 51602 TaxID=1354252 RepID=A0ABX2WBA0_9ENTR|nr:nucleotidyltransferase domain-containing protein [Buttiauxella ferragutiae]OAT30048.1 hypothetical protein M976_01168 [Buttiauxella ferragutiae ATCC 51602]